MIKALADHLTDTHFKVVVTVQDAIAQLFQVYYDHFIPLVSPMLSKLLKNVTDKKEAICVGANVIINLFQQYYGGDALVPHLLKHLD